MAHRSQRSSLGENSFDPNYLPPHYREEYRLAIDALVEDDLDGYYGFLQHVDVVDFLCHSEIEHILSTIQAPRQSNQPELPYLESEADGSSDTYWPVHSDLEAPGLDLGWPVHHGFIGPTEVTVLVNPADPEMPSIKEQARRLIKNAKQVIGVVMDIFTDVDIFADLLDAAARHVPVYILLDEQNAHHFSRMVSNCRVQLDMLPSMRIRTVSGSTYYTRTGKSFKGQMKDRFLLVDCRAVISGNYSFMWSFEKIHRCIAHLFLGELVSTFDEEFRILYAQSQPLILENTVVKVTDEGLYSSRPFSSNRNPYFKNSSIYSHIEPPQLPEPVKAYPFRDTEQSMLTFSREELSHSLPQPNTMHLYGSQFSGNPLRMERHLKDPNRPSRHLELSVYKRYSYAEGSQENYNSSQQLMKHHVQNYPDEVESQSSQHRGEHQFYYQGGGPGSAYSGYDRGIKYLPTDQYSDSSNQHELERVSGRHQMLDYLSSDSSRDLRQGYRSKPGEGHYGHSSTKRPSMGQPYICQSSPTQPHPADIRPHFPESNVDRQQRDPSVKQGLRKWRISSYLSTLDNPGEEGVSEPIGSDAFDEPQFQSEGKLFPPEISVPKSNTRDIQQIPAFKSEVLPRFDIPMLATTSKDLPSDRSSTLMDTQAATLIESSESIAFTEGSKAPEAMLKKPREVSLGKHESFRTRANPMLLRSSRLRSSLIFSSSQLEQHFSQDEKGAKEPSTNKNPNEEKDGNTIKSSSIVAQMLEKQKILSREPYDWSSHKQSVVPKPLPTTSEEPVNVPTKDKLKPSKTETNEEKRVTRQADSPKLLSKFKKFINMDDADSRLSYFKELAAKRKASKLAAAQSDACEKKIEPAKSSQAHKSETGGLSGEKGLETTAIAPAMTRNEVSLSTREVVSVNAKVTETYLLPETGKLMRETTSQQPLKLTSEVAEQEILQKPIPSKVEETLEPVVLEALSPSYIKVHDEEISQDCRDAQNTQMSATDAEKTEMLRKSSLSSGIITECSDKLKEKLQLGSTQDQIEGGGKAKPVPENYDSSLIQSFNTCTVEMAEEENTSASHEVANLPENNNTATCPTKPTEPCTVTQDQSKQTSPLHTPGITSNMLDPESRFLYFKELAARSKAAKMPLESTVQGVQTSELRIEASTETLPASLKEIPPALISTEISSSELAYENSSISLEQTSKEKEDTEELKVSAPEVTHSDLEVKESIFQEEIKQVVKINEQEPDHKHIPDTIQDVSKPVQSSSPPPSIFFCQEELLTDATDAEKSEMIRLRCQSSSMTKTQSSETLANSQELVSCPKSTDICEEKKILLEPIESKDAPLEQDKTTLPVSVSSKEVAKPSQSRYQASTANILYSSNLRDDTKVILEQISAHNQSRVELAKQNMGTSDGIKDSNRVTDASATKSIRSRFQPSKPKPSEREDLLKRIESMRKEKKVYSRFEMGS